jgi:hypothetical protein
MGISNMLPVNNSGLQLIKTQTLSGTTTQVDNCFVPEYNSYKFVFSDVTFSTIDFMTMRLVDGTTPNTSSIYYSSGLQVAGTAVTGYGDMAVSYWKNGIVGFTTPSGGVVDVYNPNLTVATNFTGHGVDTRTDGAPLRLSSGFHTATTQFEGAWFSTLNGGYTMGGTVRVYGYRN